MKRNSNRGGVVRLKSINLLRDRLAKATLTYNTKEIAGNYGTEFVYRAKRELNKENPLDCKLGESTLRKLSLELDRLGVPE